jgi:hypothetical protein
LSGLNREKSVASQISEKINNERKMIDTKS